MVSIVKPLDEGDYVLLVDYYRESELEGIMRLCSYSESEKIQIGKIYDDANFTFFNKIELEFWRNRVLVDAEKERDNI